MLGFLAIAEVVLGTRSQIPYLKTEVEARDWEIRVEAFGKEIR